MDMGASRFPGVNMRFSTCGLIIGVALAALGAPAAAATDEQICAKESGDVAIAACTRAIASGMYKGERLAKIYDNRAAEYEAKGDHDRVIADCGQAIRADPRFAKTLARRGDAY